MFQGEHMGSEYYEDELQEQLRRQRRRERMLQAKKKRRIKRRMRWVFTRVVPFCLICFALLMGIGFGVKGIITLVQNRMDQGAQDVIAEETAEQDETLLQVSSDSSENGDALDTTVSEDEALGGNDTELEEGEDLDAVPSDIEPVETDVTKLPYYALKTDHTTTFRSDVLADKGILIDPKTHTIVADKNGTIRMIPASMTKVLTLLVAAEHIKDLNDTFTITVEIGDYAHEHDLSIVGFSENEVVTVKDLLYGTILPSGGDAAIALATYVAGSEENFVKLMNEKLVELGLSETSHMTNCVGLYDEDHYSTCYDIAMIMEAALDNELCRKVLTEHIYMTSSTPEHPDGIEISNWFLRRIEDKDCGAVVLYAKTGYVKESGYCAVSYAQSADGQPYICVTGNSGSSWKCIYDHVRIYSDFYSVGG